MLFVTATFHNGNCLSKGEPDCKGHVQGDGVSTSLQRDDVEQHAQAWPAEPRPEILSTRCVSLCLPRQHAIPCGCPRIRQDHRQGMSCHVMSRHVTSRHVTSCHVMSYHVMSCQVGLHRIPVLTIWPNTCHSTWMEPKPELISGPRHLSSVAHDAHDDLM